MYRLLKLVKMIIYFCRIGTSKLYLERERREIKLLWGCVGVVEEQEGQALVSDVIHRVLSYLVILSQH